MEYDFDNMIADFEKYIWAASMLEPARHQILTNLEIAIGKANVSGDYSEIISIMIAEGFPVENYEIKNGKTF